MSQKSTRSGPPIVVSRSRGRKIKKESGVLELPFNNKYDDDDHGAAANFPQSCATTTTSSKKTTNDNNKVNNNGRPLLVYKRKKNSQNQNEMVFKKSKVVPAAENNTTNNEHSNSNYSKSIMAEAVPKGEWKSSSKYVPGNGIESNSCHQCKASKKGRVVKCNRCERKRYCVPCMTRWYPKMSEEDFANACPVCCNNCNCTVCLRKEVPLQGRRSFYLESSEEVEYSKYILQALLPFMKQFNEEQMMEKEMEAKIQGLSLSEIKLQGGRLSLSKHIYCNNCKTSIADLHRSCPQCSYDICLICCREIREGHLQGGEQEVVNSEYKSKSSKQSRKWKVLENAIIACPPEAMGGCGQGILELKHIFPEYFVSKLLVKAEAIAKAYKLEDKHETPVQIDISKEKLRRAASREDSCDNYLYCPFAAEIQPENLKHFQCHWFKGEPVIVSNVLETTYGLSWEPMVIWRVLRQISNTNNSKPNDLNIVNCSYWRKVNMNIQHFLKGYLEGEFDHRGRLQILKTEEWPPSGSFEERLPRHGVEFMSCLPFKEYTHPLDGYLNIAAKLPEEISFEPDMGPKMHIGYGVAHELEYGDSITMLHYDMSDTVNVLMHDAAVMALTSGELVQIEKLGEKHNARDEIDFFETGNMNQMVEKQHHYHHGTEIVNSGQQNISDASEISAGTNVDLHGKESSGPMISGNSFEGYEQTEGGALWDIFRRQDVPKLEEYLKKHFLEFQHIDFSPLRLVVCHQMVYLTIEHKRKLKMEYGIEPWTFVQKLGDAVFIPAGCPYQVRNLKSCINVALGFVSPENLDECIRLTNECRVLPRNHRTKKDKLKVKSMALHAMRKAVETLKLDDDGDEEDDKVPNLCSNDVDGDEDDEEPNLRSGDVDGEEEDDDDDNEDEEEELRAEALGEDIALPPVVKVEPSDTTTTPAPTDTATRPGMGVPDASTSGPCMALWEGHMVLESYVDLLSHMKREHPETFQNDTIRSASMQTYALNLLGEAYVLFAKKPMDTMDAKDIAHFRDLFSDLEQCFKFNVNWLQERVDRIDEVRFKNTRVGGELVPLRLCIEARERELSQLKALYQAKTEEVRDAHKRAADGLLIGWTPQ